MQQIAELAHAAAQGELQGFDKQREREAEQGGAERARAPRRAAALPPGRAEDAERQIEQTVEDVEAEPLEAPRRAREDLAVGVERIQDDGGAALRSAREHEHHEQKKGVAEQRGERERAGDARPVRLPPPAEPAQAEREQTKAEHGGLPAGRHAGEIAEKEGDELGHVALPVRVFVCGCQIWYDLPSRISAIRSQAWPSP